MRALIGYVLFMLALSFSVIQFSLSSTDIEAVLGDFSEAFEQPRAISATTPRRPAAPRTFAPHSPHFSAAVDELARVHAATRDEEIEAILNRTASLERWSTIIGMDATSGDAAPIDGGGLVPSDGNAMYELTLELQRELKRVGCYGGMINGVWTTNSREAMAKFIAGVNAVLSFDRPDYALLMLVRGHIAKVCETHCAPYELIARDGTCLPSTVLARGRTGGEAGSPSAAGNALGENVAREQALGHLDPATATASEVEDLVAAPSEKKARRPRSANRRDEGDKRRKQITATGPPRPPPATPRTVEPPPSLGQLR